jgi:hypothetical protein
VALAKFKVLLERIEITYQGEVMVESINANNSPWHTCTPARTKPLRDRYLSHQ